MGPDKHHTGGLLPPGSDRVRRLTAPAGAPHARMRGHPVVSGGRLRALVQGSVRHPVRRRRALNNCRVGYPPRGLCGFPLPVTAEGGRWEGGWRGRGRAAHPASPRMCDKMLVTRPD